MKKLIIETIGKVGYLDPYVGQVISSRRPTVVKSTPFIQEHIASAKLVVLAFDLPDEANDIEFEQHFKECEGDKELAVSSYVASFSPTAETPKSSSSNTLKLSKK